eukprot:6988771-Lingulodinium_polyedra.AAC.1
MKPGRLVPLGRPWPTGRSLLTRTRVQRRKVALPAHPSHTSLPTLRRIRDVCLALAAKCSRCRGAKDLSGL